MPGPTPYPAMPSGLSDMLMLPQAHVVIYVLIAAGIALGMFFWLFGSKFHRLFLTVSFLAAGIVLGWTGADRYPQVNVYLGMTVGAMIGAGLGYWLFRVWLGLFFSVIVALVLGLIYARIWAIPFLTQAEASYSGMSEVTLPGAATRPVGSAPAAVASRPSEPDVGKAYHEMRKSLSRLNRANCADDAAWRADLPFVVPAIALYGCTIMLALRTELIILAAIALIIGGVLTILRPFLINIIYTAAVGSLLMALAVAVLVIMGASPQAGWISAYPWLILAGLLLMVLVGVVFQCYYYPPPKEEDEDEESDEEEEEEDKKAAKAKKK